ncbi:hypothetical protein EMCRGX_G002274 [Ephydatia muelleri]
MLSSAYMLSFTESTDFIRVNCLELMMSTNSLANATVCINVTIIDKDIEVDEYFTAILDPVDPAVNITSKSDTILIPNDLIDVSASVQMVDRSVTVSEGTIVSLNLCTKPIWQFDKINID